MFFIMQVASIYSLRKRDRMIYFLFIAISYITLCYIKDAGFLFTPWIESHFMEDLVSIIDMTCTPFVCAYFYEATSPGVIKGRHLHRHCGHNHPTSKPDGKFDGGGIIDID